MADNGAAALAAISTLRERLSDAIWFSRGIFNHAGWGGKVESDRVDAYYERESERHREWQAEYEQALAALESESYPIADHWRRVYLGQPQIAFSDVPVERYSDGTPQGITWVMGSGEDPSGAPPNPPELGASIPSGEHIVADDDATEVDNVTGIFDDSIVREWERVYVEIADAERRLIEAQLQWQADSKTDGKKKSTADVPENPKVARLAKLIRNNPDPKRTKTDIARELADGNETEAQSLLRKLRDYPHLVTG